MKSNHGPITSNRVINGNVVFGVIITKRHVREIIRDCENINFLRSGVHCVLSDCSDIIEEECARCKAPTDSKQIRFLMANIFNPDVKARARAAGRPLEEVEIQLNDWQERLARLSSRLDPRHSFQLRTTMEPHRYHAIFSESRGIAGLSYHFKASLTTSSFAFGEGPQTPLCDLHEDFEQLWSQSRPYQPGDNERDRKTSTANFFEDDIVRSLGRNKEWMLDALKYIAFSFPDSTGNGATKAMVSAALKTNDSDCNKRMLKMERAGLLYRAKNPDSPDKCGRLATFPGKAIAARYLHYTGAHLLP